MAIIIKTDWDEPNGLKYSDLNRIEGNINELNNTKIGSEGPQDINGALSVDSFKVLTNTLLEDAAGATQLRNINEKAILTGKLGTYIVGNAYYDNSNWQRYDITKPASVLVATSTGILVTYTIGAGANPIIWQGPYNVWHDGIMSISSIRTSNSELHVETRADNPVGANVARLYLRTDLIVP